jgi:membrane protein DedA with SNARE-associated domain
MFGDGKNPFAKQSDREIRLGLVVGTLVYLAWLAMTFWDVDRDAGLIWVIRAVISLVIAYSWYAGTCEIRRRKRNHDQ